MINLKEYYRIKYYLRGNELLEYTNDEEKDLVRFILKHELLTVFDASVNELIERFKISSPVYLRFEEGEYTEDILLYFKTNCTGKTTAKVMNDLEEELFKKYGDKFLRYILFIPKFE